MNKMILYSAWMLLMCVTSANAQTNANNTTKQSLYLGPVGGFGSSWIGYAPGNTGSVFSGYAGIGLIKMETTHWGWGGQLVLSSEGYMGNYPTAKVSDVPIYLRLPLRAYYFFGDPSSIIRPNLYLGPSFGMKLAEHATSHDYEGNVYRVQNADNFRSFDAGLDGGAGIDIRLTRNTWLNLDLGYYQGLTDALKDPIDNYNNDHSLDMNVSVLFGIK